MLVTPEWRISELSEHQGDGVPLVSGGNVSGVETRLERILWRKVERSSDERFASDQFR